MTLLSLKDEIKQLKHTLGQRQGLLDTCSAAGLKQVNIRRLKVGMVVCQPKPAARQPGWSRSLRYKQCLIFPRSYERFEIEAIETSRTTNRGGWVSIGSKHVNYKPSRSRRSKKTQDRYANDQTWYVWVEK